MSETVTLRALWLSARASLAALPRDEADRDARLLIQSALRLTPAGFTANLSSNVNADQGALDHLEWMLAKRAARWPVSRILGEAPFWGRSFEVTKDTLSPRADTETLIAEALSAPFTRLLDLGTGTGCIAITLLLERPKALGVATDISPETLDVARRNAARHGVTDRVEMRVADWTQGLNGTFDLIICNPPYITEEAFATLAPEVQDHEPRRALSPGGDGLDPYRKLVATAPALLRAGGRLMFEIGFDQGAAVAALMQAAGLEGVQIVQDLNHHDRVVWGRGSLMRL